MSHEAGGLGLYLKGKKNRITRPGDSSQTTIWGAGLPSVAVDGESHRDPRLARQKWHKGHVSMLAAVRQRVACMSTELLSNGCSEPINT